MDPELRLRVEDEIHRFMVEHDVPGLAVSVVSGATRDTGHERWILGRADAASGRPLDSTTRFRLGSISKTLTAIGLARYVGTGAIDWDDAVRTLVPDVRIVADPTWKEILLGHLLTHTSGIGELSSPAALRHPLWAMGVVRPGMRVPGLDELCRVGFRCDAPPETKWAYSNPGYSLLGLVLARTAGEDFTTFVSREVATPVGMEGHAWFVEDVPPELRAAGHSVHGGRVRALRPYDIVATPAGGLLGSLEDLESLTRLVLGGGAVETGRLVDPDVWADMVRPQFRTHPAMAASGLGLWLDTVAGHTVIGHGGTVLGHSAQFSALPDVGMGVCVLANRTFLPTASFGAGHLAARIVRILLGVTQPEARLGDPTCVDEDTAALV
ncbi:MAG: beta-lactamase family protein [Acidimicrobiia bacterium]|nr:beta-lactamase family protein [Acidimicrobiia bacterium]